MKLIPIVPKGGELFNLTAIARASIGTLAAVAGEAQQDLQKTTAAWQHGVDFAITPIPGGFQVDTSDPIWHMVDEGTKPHIIVPKRKKVLVFGPGARAKTAPRVIGSGAGSKGGAPVVAHIVHHPGTAARAFSQVLQAKYDDELPRRIDAALEEALK
jgi:hypothetical protein